MEIVSIFLDIIHQFFVMNINKIYIFPVLIYPLIYSF